MEQIIKLLIALAIIVLIPAYVVTMIIPPALDKKLNPVSRESIVSIPVSEHANTLHKSLTIIDLHADSLLWDRDLLVRNDRGHVDIPRLIEGNVAVQAFTIVTKVPKNMKLEGNNDDTDEISLLAAVERWPIPAWSSLKERALYQASKLQDFAAKSNGKFTVIKSTRDLNDFLQRRRKNPLCTAGFLGVEGAHCLEGNLDNIDSFFNAGIRMMAPTHFFDNDLGSSAHGRKHGGLSDKGKDMIRRMQSKSMIVDLAHASKGVIKDALAISSKPIVVSHTGVKGTCNNARNLSDEQLVGIAQTGGVIGIGYWENACCGTNSKAIAKSIRYAANIAGVQHVALGSDFDGDVKAPFDTSELVHLTQALIDQGFNDDEIRSIMGGNALRVLQSTLPSS